MNALALPVADRPEVSESRVYYRINGGTVRELDQQMRQLGPLDRTGAHYDGYTQWHISWKYHSVQKDGVCKLDSARVTVTIQTTLPQWDPPRFSRPGLDSSWREFEAALATHENGHKAIALQAAEAILATLEALAPQDSCEALDALVSSEGNRLLAEARLNETEYDQRTRHGATQGAHLH
jgi:predicted secreted Zn-dependent protease